MCIRYYKIDASFDKETLKNQGFEKYVISNNGTLLEIIADANTLDKSEPLKGKKEELSFLRIN